MDRIGGIEASDLDRGPSVVVLHIGHDLACDCVVGAVQDFCARFMVPNVEVGIALRNRPDVGGRRIGNVAVGLRLGVVGFVGLEKQG